MKTVAALVLLSLLAPALTAQIALPVSLTGRIEAAPANPCDASATHRIACTDVLLKSATVDLNAWNGRIADVTGVLAGSPGCVSIEVEDIGAATAFTTQIALFGPRLGRTVGFTSVTPPGAVLTYLFGCGSGFLPLGPAGSYLLEVPGTVYIGTVLSIGFDLRTETIPNEPALVGSSVWSQFFYVSLTGGLDVKFLNPNCLTIQP